MTLQRPDLKKDLDTIPAASGGAANAAPVNPAESLTIHPSAALDVLRDIGEYRRIKLKPVAGRLDVTTTAELESNVQAIIANVKIGDQVKVRTNLNRHELVRGQVVRFNDGSMQLSEVDLVGDDEWIHNVAFRNILDLEVRS